MEPITPASATHPVTQIRRMAFRVGLNFKGPRRKIRDCCRGRRRGGRAAGKDRRHLAGDGCKPREES
jgi:hypothetical protein